MASLASINIRFKADLKQFSTEMQTALRELDKAGQKFQQIGRTLSVGLTLPIVAAGGAAIKFASDYEESLNKVDVAFKSSSGQVKTFAKDTLQNFGIASGTALDMASTYGDMATSLGLTTSQAAKMSTSLVGLAGDLSSFKNISIDIANTALTGIFTGETESLKKLGVVLTEANLQQFAYSQGIRTSIKDMSQAEKVQLRYNYVLSVTKNAQGDFARTQGGAANQQRIFIEGLKQLAQQFGSIVLPTFTKVVTALNGMITSFGKLSTEAKTTIVVIAGVAAAIGPVLTAVGSLLTFVPRLIIQMNALKATILANPYTAAALAITAVVVAIALLAKNTKEAVTEKQKLNSLYAEAAVSAKQETNALDVLYKTATDVSKSTKERKSAVDELRSLYPAYFKNIDDEVIKNGDAAKTYYALRDAIFAKARASAIEGELQKRANDRISKELELQENLAAARARFIEVKKGEGVEDASPTVGGKGFVSYREKILLASKAISLWKTELNKFYADAKKEDALLLSAKTENDAKSALLRQNEIDKINEANEATKGKAETEKKIIPGTIAFYEQQIAKLKEQQDNVTTTAAAYYLLGNQIAKVQEKINALQAPRLEPISVPSVGVVAGAGITGLDDKGLEDLRAKVSGAKSILDASKKDYDIYAAAVSDSLKQLSANAAIGFGETLGAVISGTAGIGAIFSGLLGMVANFMKDLGKSLIQIAVANIALKKAFANPFVALAAGIALVALGSAFQSKMSDGPQRFENGGIVGGTSFYGDKILARVNSGELILNQKQQAAVYGRMNSSSDSGLSFAASTKIQGSDLLVILERAEKKKSRLG